MELFTPYLILPLIVLALVLRYVSTHYRFCLRDIPGPFVASISDLDRIWSCATGHQMLYHIALHKKYGPLVRVGPKHVTISDPKYIPVIYGINARFLKSDFYKMFDITPQDPTIFSVRDEIKHRNIKRPIAAAYSMSTMKELEPMNDDCSAIIVRKLEGLVGENIDLGTWVHWYAFDVMTSITFSNRLGFMEKEQDVRGIIAAIEGRLVYNSIVGQVPYLHKYLFGNRLVSALTKWIPAIARLNQTKHIVAFAAENLRRYQSKEINTVELKDLLARFKRYRDGEEVMDDRALLSNSTSNIFAGADTTAISLRAIFYYLARNPSAQSALFAEIDHADAAGQLSHPVAFAEAMNMPYLQAVIKEALRMHPGVGLLLERVVPPEGAEFVGACLPGGTIVGMNPWVVARDREVYGKDADMFRPERWLDADEEKLKVMERANLVFGGGSRTCLGKNISLLEMSKLVPELLRRFEFPLADPEKDWSMNDYWFVKQTGLICKVKRRDKVE